MGRSDLRVLIGIKVNRVDAAWRLIEDQRFLFEDVRLVELNFVKVGKVAGKAAGPTALSCYLNQPANQFEIKKFRVVSEKFI